MLQPLVGLSANIFHADPARRVYSGKTLHYADEEFAAALIRAGAVPVILPASADPVVLEQLVARLDGLVLTGGADIHPASYGEPEAAAAWPGDAIRDAHELELLARALAAELPVLAVCRGIQLVNVAHGGTLYQDLPSQRPGPIAHRDVERYDGLLHELRVEPSSWLHGVYGRDTLLVNSVHHQAVKVLGEGLRATAWTADGLVEGVEARDRGRFLVGVQWHPEWLTPDTLATAGADASWAGDRLFAAFVDELRRDPRQRTTG